MDRRLICVFCSFCLMGVLLFLRVGSLSAGGALAQTAQEQSTYSLTFDKTRGQIYDCRMLPLVGEKTHYLAACMPTPENSNDLLHCSALKSSAGMEKMLENGRPFLAVCTDPGLDIPGVTVCPVTDRYSSAQLAQHVIGYLDSSGNGVTGIEKAYDEFLTETSAQSVISYQVDGLRMPLSGSRPAIRYAPVQTRGVVLTIDSRIQKVVEEVGNRMLKKGAVVVMEPSTGKIRAVASFPGYQVDGLSRAVKDQENSPMLNRAFCAYNVGSTFKIVTAAEALSEGFSPSTEFFCFGKTEVLDQTFQCHKKTGHGLLNLRTAMMGSCNPYFIQLGVKLNRERFVSMADALSFGHAGVFADGVSTAKGYLPTAGELFSPAALGNFSFGQGSLMATPVQLAQMVSAVVNDGWTPAASLVEGITYGGKLVEEEKLTLSPIQAMESRIAETIRNYLVDCVMVEENQNAKPRYVTAGGKTGTAQTGQIRDDGEELLQGWFAGFFPADKPQYVVVVLAENAQSGNQDASPVFREIADALNKPLTLGQD